jgi:L-alanine-DL-glutamate epimerase-like enolase superfamily enzyme
LAAIGAFRLWEPLRHGADADDIKHLLEAVTRLAPGALAARSALESALLDIRAQRCELPAFRLMGGSNARTLLPVNAAIGLDHRRTLEQTLEAGRSLVSSGARVIKIKVSPDSIDQNLQLVRSLKISHPSVTLFLDANQSWNSPKQALKQLDMFAAAGLDMIEQPLCADDLRGLAFIRHRTSLDVVLDESVLTVDDLLKARDAEALDVVNIKLAKAGGPISAVTMAAMARALHIPVILGSMVESTLGMLANYHAARVIEPLFSGMSVFTDVEDGLNAPIDVSRYSFDFSGDESAGLGYDYAEMQARFMSISPTVSEVA